MTDYWQIISLINEILTIYEAETFKIDYIKHGKERENSCSICKEEYVDSVSMYFPDEDKPEDYKRQYLPDLFICIDKNGIDIRVDKYVGAKNPDERMKGWSIELKFIEDNLRDVIITCLCPTNNIDFLGFKEAFNTEARKRISEMEKIIWGYSLNKLYNVNLSTQITEFDDRDDEVKEYAEMHIEINATAKDHKSTNLSDEDIKVLEEHLKRVNKGKANDERMIKEIRSDEAIMEKIDIKNIDSLWNGLVELFSQEHYSGCVKSETSIEYTQRFERYYLAYKNQDYGKEKITFELDKENNFIRCRGYIDNNDEPTWFLTFIYTEENGLAGIYATSLRELEMLNLVHFPHVRDFIRQLADAGFLNKSV